MHTHDTQLPHISELYRPYLRDLIGKIRLFSRVNILIVVDPEISLTPSPDAFGIGRVIQLIRDTSVGCIHFDVTLARRSLATASINPTPAADQPKYEGFRFDRKEPDGVTNTIDQYHEIWCFGFQPGNDDGPDSNIDRAGAVPMSDVELRVLTQWMNTRQGGLFATGDHDYLGASMCHRIPRVGTMRLWTNADGVPPIGGPDRIDTNRAATPAQADISGGSPAEMPDDVQEDGVPQPIQWIAWSKVKVARHIVKRRPHPLLCHPDHGPIDVMPDHPHEGRCFDTARDSAGHSEIQLGGSYDFGGGVAGAEYPTVGGVRPTPMVVAYGTTLPDPPYNHFKGDSPFKRFPMISVYDGHQIQLGRVVVDSTWHHWMDMNLTGIESAADTTNWEKISRYFINIALWLAPPGIPRRCITFHILESHFEYLGFREFSPRVSIFDLGAVMKRKLHLLFGPCWVNPDGVWTFKHLMTEMANQTATGIDPRDFVEQWLRLWNSPQTASSGFTAAARPEVLTKILNNWPRVGGKLDLNKSPFRLAAIVNRIDLADNLIYGGGSAGEGRFVFGVMDLSTIDNPCDMLPFGVIFEYGVVVKGCNGLRSWAQQWIDLDSHALGSAAYNAALEAITRQFTERNVAPTKPNGSALNQLRSNENGLNFLWELREFKISSTTHLLIEDTTKQTPDEILNGSSAVRDFINLNETAILNDAHVVPDQFPPGVPFMAASSRASGSQFATHFDAPGVANNDARHHFSLNTCTACHIRETGTVGSPAGNTAFLHIDPREMPARLSRFLTGSTPDINDSPDLFSVVDPLTDPPSPGPVVFRTFNDLDHRRQKLANLAGKSCLPRFVVPDLVRTKIPRPRSGPPPFINDARLDGIQDTSRMTH